MSGEDDFGDFGDFESSSVPVSGGGTDFEDFGDFESPPSAPAPSNALSNNPLGSSATDPEPGVSSIDFGEPLEAPLVDSSPTASDVADDFGDFAAPNAVGLESEANDAFGSFADAAQTASSSTFNENNPAFGSFSDSPMAAGSSESTDNFGSFGSAPMTATAVVNEDDNAFRAAETPSFMAPAEDSLGDSDSARTHFEIPSSVSGSSAALSEVDSRDETGIDKESSDFGLDFDDGNATFDDEDVREALSTAIDNDEDADSGTRSELTVPAGPTSLDFGTVAASVAVHSEVVESQVELDAFASTAGSFEVNGSDEKLDNISAREVVAAVTSAHEASEGREAEMGSSEDFGDFNDVSEIAPSDGNENDNFGEGVDVNNDDTPPPGHMQLSIGDMQEALSLAATAAAHGIDVNSADEEADTSDLDDLAMKMTDHMFGAAPEHASRSAPETTTGSSDLDVAEDPEVEAPSAEEWTEAGGFVFSNLEEADAPVEIIDLGEVKPTAQISPDVAASTESGADILDSSEGFGDFDAASPAPQSSPEIDTPGVEDGFGDFDAASKSAPLSPEINSPFAEDTFGAFGGAASPSQPSPEDDSPEAEQGFGDFDATTSSAQASPEMDLPDAEDQHGNFDETASTAHVSPEMDRADSEDGFGDFDATAESTTPETTTVNAPDEEDEFGDNDAAASSTTSPDEKNSPGSDNAFGDFGATLTTTQPSPEVGAPSEGAELGDFDAAASTSQVSPENDSPNDENGFGDFGAAASSSQVSPGNELPDDEDGFGDFDAAAMSVVEVSSENNSPHDEDGFGDFDAAATSTQPSPAVDLSESEGRFGDFDATVSSSQVPPENDSLNGEDGFGDFDAAASSSQVSPENGSPDGEDGFGDFDAAGPSTQPSPAVDSPEIEDGFGDFGAAASNSQVSPDNDSPNDDGFGDFDAAAMSVVEVSSENNSPHDEAGFGDFDAAASSVVEPSPAVDSLDDEDGFGDFDGGTTIAVADQPNMTRDDTDEDGFGEFGGSDQTPTAATNTEVDFSASHAGSTEDDDDDFGDFGSSEAVAAPTAASKESKDGNSINIQQPASALVPTAVPHGGAPSISRASWGDIDNRPVSASLSPAAMQIAQRASAVLGSNSALVDDKENAAVMQSTQWSASMNKQRLATLATAQSQTDLPEWVHDVIVNVGLDRQKLADKLLKGGLSPAGLALLAEEDRNTQWSDSNEGSKRTSFDGNGSNSRNRVPTFEDIDELDQRNGWSNSPSQSQFKTPNSSVLAAPVTQPPSQTAMSNSGFGEQSNNNTSPPNSSSSSDKSGGDFEFGSFAKPTSTMPTTLDNQLPHPPTATSSSSSSSSTFTLQASSDADFDIFGSSSAMGQSFSSGGAKSSEPISSSSSGLTSDDILAGLANYGGGSSNRGSSNSGSSSSGISNSGSFGGRAGGTGLGFGSDSASGLSQAAQDLLNKLPDLSFMTAKTLVPPSASPMLRNGAPSTFGTISSSSSSSSTYDDPFAF